MQNNFIFFLKKIILEWREVMGWVAIISFGYIYLFRLNSISVLQNRIYSFWFIFLLTVMILVWLRINQNNRS